MNHKDIITKTRNGFKRDDGSARYIYNKAGLYLGQYQPDVLSDDINAGEIWFPTYDGDKCYHTLTKEQMEQADEVET